MTPAEQPPRFRCAAGTVVGRRDGEVVRAIGIRYARAERFEAPTAQPWADEPIVATAWAPACPQTREPITDGAWGTGHLGSLRYDEHCQHLSVTAPADATVGEVLPVMVWIHGGAYVIGAGDAPITDPAHLVAEERVVVVAITYRLGIFGFLGGQGRPANLGLLDLIEALRWIQLNIAAFGGDPGNVTLFGQSAGGDAIAHLMIADGARGLFGRAIIQSAPLGISAGRDAMTASMARSADALDPARQHPGNSGHSTTHSHQDQRTGLTSRIQGSDALRHTVWSTTVTRRGRPGGRMAGGGPARGGAHRSHQPRSRLLPAGHPRTRDPARDTRPGPVEPQDVRRDRHPQDLRRSRRRIRPPPPHRGRQRIHLHPHLRRRWQSVPGRPQRRPATPVPQPISVARRSSGRRTIVGDARDRRSTTAQPSGPDSPAPVHVEAGEIDGLIATSAV